MVSLSAIEPRVKTRLLSPWAILAIAAGMLLLLVLLFNSEDVFFPREGDRPDAVSINYAEVLLRLHPDDDTLRLRLIGQLIALGEHERARKHLALLRGHGSAVEPFYSFELDLLKAQANPDGLDAKTQEALVERLRKVDRAALDNAQLERLAAAALQLEAPDQAAAAYEELAGRDAQKRRHWLARAAHWHLAANQPERAAQLYQQIAAQTDDPLRRNEYLHQAFSSLLADNRPEQAAELLAAYLEQLGDDPDSQLWLEEGVRAAQGSQRFDLAERFVQRWRELHPGDPSAMEADFQLSMASGATDRAWQVGQELLALRPEDPTLLASVARLGEWTGHPRQALEFWIRAFRQGRAAEVHEHAWRLAAQLFDFDTVLDLLAPMSSQRQMSDEELDAVVYSHETRGTPEAGETWLRDYLSRYPGQRLAWQRLHQLLGHMQKLPEASRVWADMARRFPLSLDERIEWAELQLSQFDPQSAWNVLAGVDERSVTRPDYWQLRAEIAWILEHDDDARQAYERMLALGIPLSASEEEQLVALHEGAEPRQALAMLVASLQRRADLQRLATALELAQDLRDWPTLRSLLAQGETQPGAVDMPAYQMALARLAEEDGDAAKAEAIYLQALQRFPAESRIRERLLWFYIDRGQRDALPPLLQNWRARALRESELWLPFASANLMLNRNDEALAWFHRYLKTYPDDWLVQAAYADALDAAGYQDRALRLRRILLRQASQERIDATPDSFASYLHLVSVSQGPLMAQGLARQAWNGEPAMLQLWFDRFLERLDAGNQESLRDDWLAWGRARGLKIDDSEAIQQALRNDNRVALERLLASSGLDPAQRVEALQRLGHGDQALRESLAAVGGGQPTAIQEQLLRQSVEQLESTPQGLQLGWYRKDYGGLVFKGPTLQLAGNLGNDWYAGLELAQGRYDSDDLDNSELGTERNAQVLLRRQLADGAFDIVFDGSWRDDDDRHGLGLARNWKLDSRNELQAGADWHRETDETGLLRALGMRDDLWLGGRHGLSARDELGWRLAYNRYSTRDGDDLGHGEAINLEWAHTLFFDGPAWQVRAGVDYQHNRLDDIPEDLLVSRGGALLLDGADTQDLLQDRYGQVYFGSTWRRGFPGALNRTRPFFTWVIDTMAGWQWTESEFNYGIDVGVGMEVLGDDELAFTLGYQSAPQGSGGDGGGVIGVTYSTRFGR
ncbi:tetratricopeptide repeat protein [Pseudomonas jinjuensis]|uniref:Tetratricopeptide repeat-containing protein n=1 Tax=Pseudomonas jinjuensis TaxID=198616 RepID=A0A1H0AEY5_9PSED|nr:tetratricopeptide repeat protein [Pseudomonas jinjuensis]SDN32168.1 Tetratricopeptide repeat-containing protein [Pseudomonas jinjuensis]